MPMQGTVKFYNFSKGYGFITQDGGDDIFFHVSGITRVDLEDGTSRHSFMPEEGDVVEFELEDTDKGPKAVNIQKMDVDMASEEAAE